MSTQAALEPWMLLVSAGVVFVFGSVLFMAFKANWGGHFRARSHTDSAAGLRPRAIWPGLVMLAAGIVCFLAAAAF